MFAVDLTPHPDTLPPVFSSFSVALIFEDMHNQRSDVTQDNVNLSLKASISEGQQNNILHMHILHLHRSLML